MPAPIIIAAAAAVVGYILSTGSKASVGASMQVGYPMLRENGEELRRRGVDFSDASRIFAEWTGDLYHDACHFSSPGSVALARFMAERARELPDLVAADR